MIALPNTDYFVLSTPTIPFWKKTHYLTTVKRSSPHKGSIKIPYYSECLKFLRGTAISLKSLFLKQCKDSQRAHLRAAETYRKGDPRYGCSLHCYLENSG